MNYLAHLYLSFNDEEIMVGNFIADAVKGRQIEAFPEKIRLGIRLHRLIDEFTDTHPVVEVSKSRIRENYRKYSGVVVDMYFDHFLASNWSDFSTETLRDFTRNSYKTLFGYYVLLPSRMKRILPLMAAGNWLASYVEIENISRALQGMSHRTKFISGIENGGSDLKIHYQELGEDFRIFFPELIAFSNSFLKGIKEELL
jgi:acyl carrier protein phosphodiesterase